MRTASRLFLVLLTLLLGFVFHRTVARGEAVRPHRSLQQLPLMVGPWQGLEDALPQDVLTVLGVDDYVYRKYKGKNGDPITLYVAYYGHQHVNDRIHSPSACLPAGGWLPISAGHQEIIVPDAPSSRISANRYLVEKGLDRQIVLYWFQGRGRVIADDVRATFYLAFDTLTRRGSDEMLVRINAPVRASPGEALAEELRFVQMFYPRLARFEAGS